MIWNTLDSRGQLISKKNHQAVHSSEKVNKWIHFYYYGTFFCFFGEEIEDILELSDL